MIYWSLYSSSGKGIYLGVFMKNWKYVALGDSFPAGFGVGDENYVNFLSGYLQQDLSVRVEVENYAQSGATTADLQYLLKNVDKVRWALEEADLVTLWIGWNDMTYPLSLFDYGACGGADNLDCIRGAAAELNANVDAILDEIQRLIDEECKIVIADNLIPGDLIDMWKGNKRFGELKEAAFESWQGHLVEAAESRGIDIVRSYHGFNGPAGDTQVEGVMQWDGFHLNRRGHRILADLHREVIKNI
jgi:lysophospholipase L1-like esterase